MAEENELMVSLDRIEEELAVLITEDGQSWLVPALYLPPGSREGDVLDVQFRRNLRETEALSGRVAELQRKLLERTARRSREDAKE
mgnify:CR=1 FL=1